MIKLCLREKLSYGFGDFGANVVWNAVGAFLLYYYVNVARLPVAAVGSLFLFARLFDAMVDLGVGVVVDKTRSRWGRTRPYLMFGAVPFVVIYGLTFWSPDISQNGKLAYAYLSFVALGINYSLLTIPYSALMPMMSESTAERLELGSWRAVGTALSVIVATAATLPMVKYFGHGDAQHGFTVVSAIFGLMALVVIANVVVNCRENYHDPAPRDFNVAGSIRLMFANPVWWVGSLFALLNFVRFGAVLSVTSFFAINVMQRPWMIAILLPAVSGTLVLGAFLAPPVLKRTGIKRGCIGALGAAIAIYVLLPFSEMHPILFLAKFLVASVIISLTMTAIFTMAAEAIGYHQARFGRSSGGLLSAGITLATKIGTAIGTAGVTYGLALAGYRPEAVSDLAQAGIRWSYYGWPLGVMLLQIICIAFWPERELQAYGGNKSE